MRIKKTFQGSLPENTVVNTQSDSQTNAYSCDYVNEHFGGTVLYSNSTGTTGNVPLSSNVSDYSYIEIYWKNGNRICLKKINVENGKYFTIDEFDVPTNGYVTTFVNKYRFNGSQLSFIFSGHYNMKSTGVTDYATNSTTSDATITRVVGYK